MPSFIVTLKRKNVVYNLYQEIIDQYVPDTPGVKVASQWPDANIQSDYDNVNADGTPVTILTSTDANLSGMRHGRTLLPGDNMRLTPGNGKFISTTALYFLCQEKDGVQLNVDLIGDYGYNPELSR